MATNNRDNEIQERLQKLTISKGELNGAVQELITSPNPITRDVEFKRLIVAQEAHIQQLYNENTQLKKFIEQQEQLKQEERRQIEEEMSKRANEYGTRFFQEIEAKHKAHIEKLKAEHNEELRQKRDHHAEYVANLHKKFNEQNRLLNIPPNDEEVQQLIHKHMPSSNISDAVFQTCVTKQEDAQSREALSKKAFEAAERKMRARVCARMAWEAIVEQIKPDYQSYMEIEKQREELRNIEREAAHKRRRLNGLSVISRYDNAKPCKSQRTSLSYSSASSPSSTPKKRKFVEVLTSDDDDDDDDEDMAMSEPLDPVPSPKHYSFNFGAGK